MTILLWIGQALLALGFLYSGISKTFLSQQKMLAMGQTGVDSLPLALVRFIGIIELAGVMGIILPEWLDIVPVLTSVSAIGMAVIMIPAAVIHYRRKEPKNVMTNIFLFIVASLVAWGRLNGL